MMQPVDTFGCSPPFFKNDDEAFQALSCCSRSDCEHCPLSPKQSCHMVLMLGIRILLERKNKEIDKLRNSLDIAYSQIEKLSELK